MSARRILIVDDDESVRSLLRLTLPAEGHEVVEARDGDHALELVSASVPDLVLLDWRMPGRPGADILSELKARYPAVQVVVLTAELANEQRELAESLGADAFLTKPFSPLQLLEIVERLLAQRAANEGP